MGCGRVGSALAKGLEQLEHSVAVIDRDASASLSRNNPWHGHGLTSRVVHTVYAGRVTVRDGALAR